VTTPGGCSAWAQVDDIPQGVAELHSPVEWCGYLGMATDILWGATGRRWRGGPLTAEVVLRAAPPRAGEPGWPYSKSWGRCACYAGYGLYGPQWADPTRYQHYEPVSIRLPHPDVVAVTVVAVDEAPFTGWRLDGAWLSRTDGDGWSMCGDTTTATYTYGRQPPDAGRLAVVELAVELGRAASPDPDQPCALPKRLQSITRQGISFAALDDMAFLDEGLTGLYAVDLWIRAVNPYGRKQSARVWSPDLPRARSTT
jgi:hypothetical protein